MIITIVLLFTSMVLSAMASSDAKKGAAECKEGCSKYAMWSALVSGISVAVVVIVLIVYVYSTHKEIATAALEHVTAMHGALSGVAGQQGISAAGGGGGGGLGQ